MANRRERQCFHCKELFRPHCRNDYHQEFCSRPACRKASKAESQRRWLSKSENRDYFRGQANAQRVRQWRKEHPGYWKRPAKAAGTLQELLPAQPPDPQLLATKAVEPPLQDLLRSQHPLLVGLISFLIDSPLQDHIAEATHRLITKGRSILDMKFGIKCPSNDENPKTNPLSGANPTRARSV